MRRQLRDQVEGQRRRASRGAENALDRRGLFGESTIAAQALAGIGGESTRAIGEGETAIEGMEFKRDLERFLIEQQKPSFLESALPVLGQGLGAIAGFALGGPPGAATGAAAGRGLTGGSSAQDPFGILGQSGVSPNQDLVEEAKAKFRKRQNANSSGFSDPNGQFNLRNTFGRDFR